MKIICMEGGRETGIRADPGRCFCPLVKPKETGMTGGKRILKELLENEAFCTGVAAGIDLYQCKVVNAHDRKEPIKIGENIYYIQDGRERLAEVMDRICR